MEIKEKLLILSQDSQYDLACSCSHKESGHRRRSKDDMWVYPVVLPYGGEIFLFKTLMSNSCVNDCRYCPFRVDQNIRRCTLEPEEIVKAFVEYYRAGKVMGLFISSGVMNNPDVTMSRINKVAIILRRMNFKGYIHLKVIPGASDASIEEAVSLANAVSVNIETAGENNFKVLSSTKDYKDDVIRPIQLISKLTGNGSPYSKVKQTTQFVVGASNDTDREIVKYSWRLYKRLELSRIYFSAYQRGLGESAIPGEVSSRTNADLLTREHRLYQVDWLIRKYGFTEEEIPFEQDENLSLDADPKEIWANRHPYFFPLDVNRADKYELLRIPGFGPVTVNRILELRKNGSKIRSISYLGNPGKRLMKASKYIKFGY